MSLTQSKISLFRRIATYRSLPRTDTDFYCTKLAECGYIYTGHELDIECVACKAKTRISESCQETEKYLRHERGCEFHSIRFLNFAKELRASVDNSGMHGAGAMGVDNSTSINSSSLTDDGATGLSRSNASALDIDGCNETFKAQEATASSKDDQFVSSATSSLYNIDLETQFRRVKERNGSSSSKSSGSSFDSPIEHVDFPQMFMSEHLEILKETANLNSSGPECDKNPGHFAYFKINSLQLEQIPSKVRCQEMIKLLKKIGELTARISVQPLNSHRSRRQFKLGTGFSILHSSQVIKTKDKEKFKIKSFTKILTKNNKKSLHHVYVHTSRHLVLNDEEAEKTEVEFFSDGADRRDIVILKGSHLMYSTTPGDSQCLLVCECSDIGFIEKLDQLQNEFYEAVNSLPLKAKKGMLNKLFLVHHPHGGDKVLSYGDYVKVKYKFFLGGSSNQPTLTKLSAQEQVSGDLNLYRKVLFYASDTCPGSCGAPLLTFSRRPSVDSSLVLDLWMHNGVETTHKLGASMIKMCTVEDFYQPPPQSEHPEEDSDDEGSLAKQPVNSPVYKVISTPSYPEHVMFQTRLKSFDSWSFHNILQPQSLASLGFFYTGDLDCVRCFQCGLGLRSWKPGDDVLTQHEKYRPTCPYLRSLSKAQDDVRTGAAAVLDTSNSANENTILRLLKAEHTALKQQLTCKVCYKSEIKDVFLPCGELYACSDCSKLLTHCPSCKKQILATITVYLT